jgi:hypothetical protein
VGLGSALSWGTGLASGARGALAAALLAPLGLLVGSLAPLGVKLVATSETALLPWCLGLSGFAGAIATPAGALLAMNLGYSALLLAAGVVYWIAAAIVPPPATQGADGGGGELAGGPLDGADRPGAPGIAPVA